MLCLGVTSTLSDKLFPEKKLLHWPTWMENFRKIMRLINESGKHRYHATLARSTTVYFAPKKPKIMIYWNALRNVCKHGWRSGRTFIPRDYFLTLMGILCHAVEQPSCLIISYNYFRLFRALSDVMCIIYETSIPRVFMVCLYVHALLWPARVCIQLLLSDWGNVPQARRPI